MILNIQFYCECAIHPQYPKRLEYSDYLLVISASSIHMNNESQMQQTWGQHSTHIQMC
jgi:hypothetical protein